MYDIDTLRELMDAAQSQRTRGYDVRIDVLPVRTEADRGWLIIVVDDTDPGRENINGEYWFFADSTVMQVL